MQDTSALELLRSCTKSSIYNIENLFRFVPEVLIGSDNDLVLIRQETIVWTNDDQDKTSAGHNELNL